MCTVTFVSNNGKKIITSSRDEKSIRPQAIIPKTYSVNSKKIIFPKDPKAGGTWYAINEDGDIIVLLNGASEKHIPKDHYEKSRGIIVLDIISSKNCLQEWNLIELDTVEPFTLVFFSKYELYQLRWNGLLKETTKLDSSQNYIWSSATLYSKEIRTIRENWFVDYLKNNKQITSQQMLDFHKNTENEDKENGLIINRNDAMITQSITQTEINANKINFTHLDLIDNVDFNKTILLL